MTRERPRTAEEAAMLEAASQRARVAWGAREQRAAEERAARVTTPRQRDAGVRQDLRRQWGGAVETDDRHDERIAHDWSSTVEHVAELRLELDLRQKIRDRAERLQCLLEWEGRPEEAVLRVLDMALRCAAQAAEERLAEDRQELERERRREGAQKARNGRAATSTPVGAQGRPGGATDEGAGRSAGHTGSRQSERPQKRSEGVSATGNRDRAHREVSAEGRSRVAHWRGAGPVVREDRASGVAGGRRGPSREG